MITPTVTGDLALCVAQNPDPNQLAAHLAAVTFADLRPLVITFYMRDTDGDTEVVVLVGHYGLTQEESARYAHIQPDFPMPAADAMRHALPFSMTIGELAEQFPLLRIRPDLDSPASQLGLPITIQGITVGAVLVTLDHPFAWNPTTWQTALAIQALLSLYVRTSERGWSPLRPRNPAQAVRQGLTPRQISILELVGQGRSTSAIAVRLGFSASTIKQDLRRAMAVLEVTDRRKAVERARAMKLIPAI